MSDLTSGMQGGFGDPPSDSEKEDELWEKVDSVRHKLTRILNPAKLTPYLRQCKAIDEQDEEEVLNSLQLPLRINRAGRLVDILRQKGRRGYDAFMESLEFYHPDFYTNLTGREPTQRCSIILDEEGPEGLTQFLLVEVKKLREQLKESRLAERRLSQRCRAVDEERRCGEERLRLLREERSRLDRLTADWESSALELSRAKEHNYTLALKYSQALEEKGEAMSRARELQLQVDLLKNKLLSLEEEVSPAPPLRLDSDRLSRSDSVTQLLEENRHLKDKLTELQSAIQRGTGNPILLEILHQDHREALEHRNDLCNTINRLQGELMAVESHRDKLLTHSEKLEAQIQALQRDCAIERKRNISYQTQLQEIQRETYQALRSRDTLQLQYTECMLGKNDLRKVIEELRDANGELERKLLRAESAAKRSCLDCSPLSLLCDGPCSELCCSLYEERLSVPEETRWGSSKALPKLQYSDGSCANSEEFLSVTETEDSEKDINRLSIFPFPPCAGSILRRNQEHDLLLSEARFEFDSWGSDDNLTGPGHTDSPLSMSWSSFGSQIFPSDLITIPKAPCTPNLSTPNLSTPTVSTPDLFRCPVAPPTTDPGPAPLLQKGSLAADITIVGGNRTGVFVSGVKEGSRAEQCGLKEGCQLLELLMGGESLKLDSCTKEVAHFSLQGWTEPSALKFKHNNEGYRELCQDLQSRGNADSFYVRVNLDIRGRSDCHSMEVRCDDIIHVVDTVYQGRYQWFCSRVDPTSKSSLDSGTVPNYTRAQQLFLVRLRTLALERKDLKNKLVKKSTERVRLVKAVPPSCRSLGSSPRLVYTLSPRHEDSLSPYSLVQPVPVQSKRPVIFSPYLLSRGLIERLLQPASSGLEFNTCHPEPLSEADQRDSRVFPLGASDQGIRLESIQEVMSQGQHCLLELSIRCVEPLIRNHIYPLVIHIPPRERSIRRLRKLLRGPHCPDEEAGILSLCRAEEQLLESLPLRYSSLGTEAWSSADELTRAVRERILRDQRDSVVWVESEERRGGD
ncbi:caspase recruitment domain-containing protein 10-like [Acipenser ruthenus]|uniref:caspase recruitment domain-containing protein 10-like n=1 Tax=Acipenser ruthenus TaxID=7906 RepID=UPI0027403E45|nr:caspase recruitment domain-containing protein 10-like [Acipenser ruthenus]